MALPSFWVSVNRKDLAERAIVAKREKEATRAQKCKEVASYHKELALKSSKYKSLEESQPSKTPRANEESRIQEKIKADAREKLEIRRQKLSHMLAIENEQYMKELKVLKDTEREKDPWNISHLKEQIEELQRKRKEGEQNMQKRYMHHLYRPSNISLKEDDDEKMQKEAAEAWEQRKEELQKLSLERKHKEDEKIKTLELEQLKATREAREVEIKQLEEQEKWSNFVQNKVQEICAAENEIKKLNFEKQILMGHMDTLLSLQNRRGLVRDLQQRGIKQIHAMWQPKEKLRRMSNEVQHALDVDLKLLLTLSELNKSAAEDTALALLNLDCVKDTKDKIEMQIAMEKGRELEIQQLFNEEASKLWETRQKEWNLESIARDGIMTDLFKILVDEVNRKAASNLEQQKKFIQVKESCLQEIETANDNAKALGTSLEEQKEYLLYKAKRLDDELTSFNVKLPVRSDSAGKCALTPYS